MRATAIVLALGIACWLAPGAARPASTTPAQSCERLGFPAAGWLRRVVEVAGYRVEGCTASAWIASTTKTRFLIRATKGWRPSGGLRRYGDGLPYPAYTDGTRVVWAAQGLGIWIEPGPGGSDTLPGKSALSWLQVTSRGLPRRYERIAFMATPAAALRQCRSDVSLRPACPSRIPRVRALRTYPRVVDGIFGLQLGGEIPDRPELQRPPHVLHIEVAIDRPPNLQFKWPTTGAIKPHDGLLREARRRPVYLGRARWAGKPGSVALAPAYPLGGSQGNHLIFRWREHGTWYVVGMHAWEPFTEALATLRRIVASLPR
jgi:hypothetical protein